ncbi:MAG: histidinol-phosphatase [Caldisericia bacterium]|nr:histidinol-phosphatase [Caldisericia bacterium]
MSTLRIFENGAAWLKADFHLHTGADGEFSYTGNNFIFDYISALKEADIKTGVITNHNKFDIAEFKELRKEGLKNEIYFLPGVEFSIKDGSKGLHLLIIFSDDWIYNQKNKNYIQDFLTSAFSGIANPDSSPYPNSKYDLQETYNQLNQFKNDYFFVLAHVDETNGLFKELSGRNLSAFVKQEAFQKVLAIQKSGNKENYDNLCNLIGRKIACVEGTDNAQNGLDAIKTNSRFCYLKLGDFNFDAVKFSLIANEQRIALKQKPEIKNSHIKFIEFKGGLLDGQKIYFSPELNTLIGIRGSGKSAIIEIIRYALGIPFTRTSVDQEYKNSLVKYVLGSGGKIILEIVNNHDKLYKVEKILGQKEDIYEGNSLLNGITINAIIEKPVYFGQKDLSNKDADFESDLLKRLIGNKLDDIKKQVEKKNHEIKEIVFQLQKSKNLDEQKKEAQTAIENSNHQLQIFKDKGVEEKLKNQTFYETDVAKLNNYKDEIKNFIDSLSEILRENSSIFESYPDLSELNKKYIDELKELVQNLKNEKNNIEKALQQIIKFYDTLSNMVNSIVKDKENLKEEFAKIKREISIPSINPDNFIELKRIIQTNELKLKEIEKSEAQKQKYENELLNRLTELNNLWHQEFTLLKNEIDKINQNQTKLTIEIEYKARRDQYLDTLKRYFKGSNIRESAYQDITNNYTDFIELYKEKSKLNNILNLNQLPEFEKKFNENLFELLTYRVEDKIIIKYNGKELSKQSLGQRASALILFLLSQKEQNILIIDQPEDDLDNQTIYDEVIKEIIKLKGKMQFIFATHNANIPVLGDSEKVIVCKYEESKITVDQGTIDMPYIQKSVVEIMEGGFEAFNKRKEIYNIWKS